MTLLLQKEVQLHELRHLASEICQLVVPTESARANGLQVAELAQTVWNRLRDIGPLMDGYGNYFKALNESQVECLFWDEAEGAGPIDVYTILDVPNRPTVGVLRCLEEAEFCSEGLYADVKTLSLRAANRLREAEQRWEQAEQELLAEGLLPVRRLAPSAGGGNVKSATYLTFDCRAWLKPETQEGGQA